MRRGFVILLATLCVSGFMVSATAAPAQYTLTISASGNGTTDPAPGAYSYRKNTVVSVTAIPDSGYVFDSWTGDLSGSTNPTTIKMTADKSVTAVFVEEAGPTTYTLTTAVQGSGSIDPAAGVHTYNENDVVTVTATEDAGWSFDHWEGDLSGSVNPDTVTMTADLSVTAVFVEQGSDPHGALQRYVDKPDANFTYSEYHSSTQLLYTEYFYEMTSQQWRDLSEVDRCMWQHYIPVAKPWFGGDSSAILVISGGDNLDTPPTSIDDGIGLIAALEGLILCEVKQVPNQPLFFTDEVARERTEDEILAYSLDKYLDTGDEEWPVHLAMVKSCVRAMDLLQAEVSGVDDFIAIGGSKRGWTAYLLAAVDPRVIAIAPASIDVLDLDEQMLQHWEAYGFYTPAVQDYVEFDIFCRMGTPEGLDLLQIVDPYTYLDQLTVPKLINNSSGDQFFASWSSQNYYHDLLGRKIMRYSINTDHGQDDDTVLEGAIRWAQDIQDGINDPQFSWTFEGTNTIRVTCSSSPNTVKLWQATNPLARDFRLEEIGPAYTSTVLSDLGGGVYEGTVADPAQGWTCFVVELDFGDSRVYTTDMRVTPDTFPFAGTACP